MPAILDSNMIGWIGLGKCGLPIAENIGQRLPVISYDIETRHTKHSTFTKNPRDLLDTEMVFALVPTPHIDPDLDGSRWIDLKMTKDYDYSAVREVCCKLSDIKYDQPIVICSTVSPGTIRKLSHEFPSLNLAYMPVMIHIGSVAEDFVSAPMYFIGAVDDNGKRIQDVMMRLVNTAVFLHGTPDEVELYKLFGNMYSSVKIAFANTISEMIEYGNLNASSWNVMTALLHDTKNFNTSAYLMPGSGNGGPCHPRDGVVLSHLTDKFGMRSQLLKAVTQVRQDQALALAEYLVATGLPVVILGKSFKQGVDLTVGSYSVLVGNICSDLGASVQYDTCINTKAVVLLAHRDPMLLKKYAPTSDSLIVDLWNCGLENHNVKVWGKRLQ